MSDIILLKYKVKKRSNGKYVAVDSYGVRFTKSGSQWSSLDSLNKSISPHISKKALEDTVVVRFATKTVESEMFGIQELPDQIVVLAKISTEKKDYADYVRLKNKFEPDTEPVPYPEGTEEPEYLSINVEMQGIIDTVTEGL